MAEYLSINANITFLQGYTSEFEIIERVHNFLSALEVDRDEVTYFNIHKKENETDKYNLNLLKDYMVERPCGVSLNIMQRNPLCNTEDTIYEIKQFLKYLENNSKVYVTDYSFFINNQTDKENPSALVVPKDKEDYKLRYL